MPVDSHPDPHPCPDAPPFPEQLLALVAILRQPDVTGTEVRHCASQLDALAARATWAIVIVTNLLKLTDKLNLAVDEVGKLAFASQDHADRALEVLQGAGEVAPWHRPDAAGAYAWDRWQTQARAAGLDPELAELGRAVMREAAQHDWDSDFKAECGWLDAGQAMLERALHECSAATESWRYLLRTDGERGHWSEDGEWHGLRPGGSW